MRNLRANRFFALESLHPNHNSLTNSNQAWKEALKPIMKQKGQNHPHKVETPSKIQRKNLSWELPLIKRLNLNLTSILIKNQNHNLNISLSWKEESYLLEKKIWTIKDSTSNMIKYLILLTINWENNFNIKWNSLNNNSSNLKIKSK